MTGNTLHAARYSTREEIANAVTHGVGIVLGITGLVLMIVLASERGDAALMASCIVFGASMVLLYSASTTYHSLTSARAKAVFQHLDHAAIYFLIAGTYTPFTLSVLQGTRGWIMFVTVWGLAALGTIFDLLAPARFKRISLVFYLGLGWMVVLVIEPLLASLETGGVLLLVAGGASYSIGALFYAWRRLPLNHAIWHMFVLVGTACHLCCVVCYVILPET